MNKIKYLTRELENAIAKANLAEEALEKDYTNKALDAEWEKCYDWEIKVREQIAAEIVKATAGEIDEKTAYKMTFNPKFYDIVAKIA